MSFALLCPGQGAQTPGFLQGALAADAEVAAALADVTGLTSARLDALGVEALCANTLAQPCLMAWQLAIWRQLGPLLPTPTLAMGYSLGALVAAVCATGGGVGKTLAPAFELARVRAQAMDEACAMPCAMLAVRGLEATRLAGLCAPQGWHLAIRNGEDRFVIAGGVQGRALVEAGALAAGASVTPLRVTTPSHTPLLADAVGPFRAALAEGLPQHLGFGVISALDGALVRNAAALRERLARELAEPLDWAGAMDALDERGVRLCLELGPGADLSRMLRERHPHIAARSVSEFAAPADAVQWLRSALAAP